MNKTPLRHFFRAKIKNLSKNEKALASERARKTLFETISSPSLIGSFSPLSTEIDLYPFNHFLAQQKCLALPKCEKETLCYYRVINLEQDLEKTKEGLFEPNPLRCAKVHPLELSLVLVPALSFDSKGTRLGHGGGFFDRFLNKNPRIQTLGLIFKVQMSKKDLPKEPHDHVIKKVLAF